MYQGMLGITVFLSYTRHTVYKGSWGTIAHCAPFQVPQLSMWRKIDNKVIQVEGKIYWEAKSTL